LTDYEEYPFKISTEKEDRELITDSLDDCAYYCTSEKNFTCRSFSFCKQSVDEKVVYKCLLSKNHNDNLVRNPNLTVSDFCDHYSSIIKLDAVSI
jgi:hypothetical protein